MRVKQKLYLPVKRLFGFVGSLIGIILCISFFWWWIIPINAIVTKGHPFFVQKRYGKNKKIFKMIKFRSMKLGVDPNLPPSDMSEETQKRMDTKFGSFLRKTSLDETPQLLNILFGQMAFIGPRPGSANNEELLATLRESSKPSAFDVRPGLGGYAQLKMKRDHDPVLKSEFDCFYVKNLSFWFDVKIFFKTIFGIFGSVSGK